MKPMIPKETQIIEDICVQEKEKIVTPLKERLDTLEKLRDNLLVIMGTYLTRVRPEYLLDTKFNMHNANKAYILINQELRHPKSRYHTKMDILYQHAQTEWDKIHADSIKSSCVCGKKLINVLIDECNEKFKLLEDEINTAMQIQPRHTLNGLSWMLNVCDKHLKSCSGDGTQKKQGYQPGKDKYNAAIKKIAWLSRKVQEEFIKLNYRDEDSAEYENENGYKYIVNTIFKDAEGDKNH